VQQLFYIANKHYYIRLAVVAYQICEITGNSATMRTFSSSVSSKVP